MDHTGITCLWLSLIIHLLVRGLGFIIYVDVFVINGNSYVVVLVYQELETRKLLMLKLLLLDSEASKFND